MKPFAACLMLLVFAGSAIAHDHYYGSRPTYNTGLRFGYDYAYPRYRLLDVYGGYGFTASRSSFYATYGVRTYQPSYYPRVSGLNGGYGVYGWYGHSRFSGPAYSTAPGRIKFVDPTGSLRHINP